MVNRNGGMLNKYGTRVLIGVVVLLLLLPLLLLSWLWSFVQPEGFEQRVDFIKLAATVVGGATLVGGLLLNFWGQWINQKTQDENQKRQIENQRISLGQLANAQEQLDLTRGGQITERFTKAFEHLGDEKTEIRLGGIAALKQIADQDESSDRRWQIMEILTAYVRGRAQYKGDRRMERRDEDIQAALNVIGDLTKRYGTHRDERYLSLATADLMNLNLEDMHLQGVNLTIAHLEGASLMGAHLEGSELSGAHLEGAFLYGAHLEGANLHGAHLEGAHLLGTKLAGTTIGGANLLGANLQKAEFEAELPTDEGESPEWWSMLSSYKQQELAADSDNGFVKAALTHEMVKHINGDRSTNLPRSYSEPVWWSTLSSSLPDLFGIMRPGEYHIKLGNIPMSLSVDEGWHSDLSKLPYAFSLTLGGDATAGSIVTFRNVHAIVDPVKFKLVVDPDKPGEFVNAVSTKPPNLFRWFSEHCRDYLEVGKPEKVQPPIGDAVGIQFEARVPPGKGLRDLPGTFAPLMPTFPQVNPRELPSFLPEGYKNLIIVLDVAEETIIITVMSPESQFEQFRERTRNVLGTVKWLTLEQLEKAEGGGST